MEAYLRYQTTTWYSKNLSLDNSGLHKEEYCILTWLCGHLNLDTGTLIKNPNCIMKWNIKTTRNRGLSNTHLSTELICEDEKWPKQGSLPFTELNIPQQYWWYLPIVLVVFLEITTEYPQHYWRYLSTILNIFNSTKCPPLYWWHLPTELMVFYPPFYSNKTDVMVSLYTVMDTLSTKYPP